MPLGSAEAARDKISDRPFPFAHMKYGANTLIWALHFGPPHFELLPRIKAAGLDGVEVAIFDPRSFPASDVRRELQKNGLACTACSVMPGGASLGADDAGERRLAREHIVCCLKAAAELGAELLGGPLYSPVGFFTRARRTESEWRRAVECWQELRPIVAQTVPVAIEPLNRFETYFLNTAEDAARLCDAIGDARVGILIDTFHANIEEKSIGAALRHAGKHLKHLHTCENDRGIPGSGHVNWPEFFDAVRDLRYDGWLTIESFGFSLGEVAAAASIWRDLAPSPEAIAFEGVQFLRAGAGLGR
jgi:D-psicose/D-tagatose/L-ribulose 3-epimerase